MAHDSYTWPEEFKSAACLTVDLDAHSPHFWINRKGMPQLMSHLEQRRFGPRVGIYRILDLYDRFGIKGTFFVPGKVAEDYPELLPLLTEKGHEVGLHGYFHELANDLSDEGFTHALEASIALFEKQTGRRPKGFRSPAWEMTPHMLQEVKRLGFYDSSLMGYDHPYTVDGVTEVPVQWTLDDAIYFKFLGGGVDLAPPAAPGPLLDGWLDEWEVIHRYGSLFMLTIHDWISGRAQRIAMLEKLLTRITAEKSVWWATVSEVAEHHERTQKEKFVVDPTVPQGLEGHPAWIG
ncbi:polysaccharide deacetylase family protein [Lutibaculum baratangense]|uniref:Chitooligosaccharide deacetylase n=1 Tax=Lutibaculum baratangense AMV1 TaxID=631454 RepID=V4REF2_9HYPH|nr:polysaccharide deacetylase [Lutibaculum baratangense]ESR23769.1 polysaccharide deacetylase [Lutibaculum baratangense AMV1]